jgi:hypothetical protein
VGVKILSPEEAVAFVHEKIRDRDSFNEQVVQQYGGRLLPFKNFQARA